MHPTLTKQLAEDHIRELRRVAQPRFPSLRRTRRAH
jgi:hypothetical protein